MRNLRGNRRNVILDEFLAAAPYAFTVTAKDGVVTLAGEPDTSEVAHELVLMVRVDTAVEAGLPLPAIT